MSLEKAKISDVEEWARPSLLQSHLSGNCGSALDFGVNLGEEKRQAVLRGLRV